MLQCPVMYPGLGCRVKTLNSIVHTCLKYSRMLQAVAHEPGVDVLAFETVPAAAELRAISRLLRTEGACAHLPAWVACSCRDAVRACGGASLAGECLPAVLDAPAVVAFGVNCTAPQHAAPLLRVTAQLSA